MKSVRMHLPGDVIEVYEPGDTPPHGGHKRTAKVASDYGGPTLQVYLQRDSSLWDKHGRWTTHAVEVGRNRVFAK